MSVVIKTPKKSAGCALAGRLAAEVLDYIAPHVKPGVTTGKLERLCHDYMVDVQGTVPAPLNYAPPGYKPYPKSICTSVNHQVCHGIPGDRVLKPGDIVNIDITVIKDGYHGDTSRMYYVGEPSHPGAAAVRGHLRVHVARHRAGAPGRARSATSARDPDPCREARLSASCASSAATASAASSTRSRRSCTTARPATGLRAGARHDLHRRADDQRRQAPASANWPTAGPSSPRTTACRRSGSTRCW